MVFGLYSWWAERNNKKKRRSAPLAPPVLRDQAVTHQYADLQDDDYATSLLNPLNPLSPLFYGHHQDHGSRRDPDETPAHRHEGHHHDSSHHDHGSHDSGGSYDSGGSDAGGGGGDSGGGGGD